MNRTAATAPSPTDTEGRSLSPTGLRRSAAVSAMADGVIAQVWEDVSMGQCVAIANGGDSYTIYSEPFEIEA